MKMLKLALALLFALVCWTAASGTALAGPPGGVDSEAGPTALTTADPTIEPTDLKILLTPLPRAQLEIELADWFALVQGAAEEVSQLELKLKREERARTQHADAPAGVDNTAHDDYVNALADLIAERTEMVDRFKQVLAALQDKGGDVEEHKQYLSAVMGVNVDATDAGSTYKGLMAWVKSGEGGQRWLANITKFFAIIVVFIVLAYGLGFIVKLAVRRTLAKRSQLLASFVVSMTRRVVLVIGILVALTALEVDMTPIFALIGATGFVVGFALQGTLGNLASGLMILAYTPFDVGDAVTVSGVTGKVDSMNLFSTTIKTFDNQVIIIPNNQVWNGVITNITGSERRRVDLVFGIGYGDDQEKAAELLGKILADHPLVLEEPEPIVKLNELADSSVNFVCRPWCETENYWDVYWDVTRTVKETFDREGISIPFPQRDIHIVSQAPSTTPRA